MVLPAKGILFSTSKISYQAMKRHRGKLNAYEKPLIKRLHSLWFQLSYILEGTKLQSQEGLVVAKGKGKVGMNRHSIQGFYGSESTLYEALMMVYVYTFAQTHRMYNTKNQPQGKLWIRSDHDCQFRFILGHKCDTLVSDVDRWGVYVCKGVEDICEFSVPSFQFCCEPKADLKY